MDFKIPNIPNLNSDLSQPTAASSSVGDQGGDDSQQKKYPLPGESRNMPLRKRVAGKAPSQMRHRTQADLIVDTSRSSGQVDNIISKVNSKHQKERARDVVNSASVHVKGDYEIDSVFAHKNANRPVTSWSRARKSEGVKNYKAAIPLKDPPRVDDLQID